MDKLSCARNPQHDRDLPARRANRRRLPPFRRVASPITAALIGAAVALSACARGSTGGLLRDAQNDPLALLAAPLLLPFTLAQDTIDYTVWAAGGSPPPVASQSPVPPQGEASAPGSGSNTLSDALDLAITGVGAAGAIMGSGASRAPVYQTPNTRVDGNVHAYTGGYSQRQAFDDCARMYQNAPQLEAQCRANAGNMNSMGPMLRPTDLNRPGGRTNEEYERVCGAYSCR